MICPTCGHENDTKMLICSLCGTRLEDKTPPTPARALPTKSESAPAIKTSPGGGKIFLSVVGLLVLLAFFLPWAPPFGHDDTPVNGIKMVTKGFYYLFSMCGPLHLMIAVLFVLPISGFLPLLYNRRAKGVIKVGTIFSGKSKS